MGRLKSLLMAIVMVSFTVGAALAADIDMKAFFLIMIREVI